MAPLSPEAGQGHPLGRARAGGPDGGELPIQARETCGWLHRQPRLCQVFEFRREPAEVWIHITPTGALRVYLPMNKAS
jgi:hypothetical protein